LKTQEVIGYIVKWLKDYCVQAGSSGLVVGISGGIDSSVVSTLCAMTELHTFVVEIPIDFFRQSEVGSKAEDHYRWLRSRYPNVEYLSANLTGVFEELENEIGYGKGDRGKLESANICSRLRMVVLYAYAARHSSLVVGTGNKVEDFGIGFFTKYGDGAVDISPIGDLLKSEVYEIGEELGLLDEILEAAPTDGLWEDGRTDEEQIGATYEELEWAMSHKLLFKNHLSSRQKEVLKIYETLSFRNQHKMKPIPICKVPDKLKGSINDLR